MLKIIGCCRGMIFNIFLDYKLVLIIKDTYSLYSSLNQGNGAITLN